MLRNQALRVVVLVVVAISLSQDISAETFWANYQPSLATPVPFNDVWPGTYAEYDALSLSTLGPGGKYTGWTSNIFGNQFFDWDISTEFTVDDDFSATHVTLPVYSGAGVDSLFGVGFSVWNEDTNTWDALAASSRIRGPGFRSFGATGVDWTIPFGNNSTGSAGGFNLVPLDFEAGRTYQLFLNGRGAGSVGGYFVYDSLVDGPSTNTFSDYAPNDLLFQPAFALNDGVNSLIIPEPASALWLALGTSLLLRQRRNNRED